MLRHWTIPLCRISQVSVIHVESSRVPHDLPTISMRCTSALLLGISLISGCASVVTGDKQYVSINVTCKGRSLPTHCVASNAKGSWNFYTPESKVIQRDASPLRIACHSPSVGQYGIYQYPVINPASFGNVLAGGVVGATVDASNGSLWHYPESISMESEFCKGLRN